jgi:hypothetical protein
VRSPVVCWERRVYLMYRVTKRLSDVSRRAIVLFSIGVVWVVYGYAIFTTPLDVMRQQAGRSIPLTRLLAVHWSGTVWVVAGAIGIVVSLFRRRLHPHDAWGFNALLIPALIWSLLSAWSWVVYVTTDGILGNARGWVSAVVWAAMAVWVLITASWADPEHLRGHPKEQYEERPDQSDGD